MHRYPAHTLAASLGETVMTVDHVIAARGDLREENRVRQVGCEDGCFIEIFANAIVSDVRKLDEFDGEPLRMDADKVQESRDIELEDAVRIQLIARLGSARLESAIQFKSRRLLKRF
jgi:hypothetical protein